MKQFDLKWIEHGQRHPYGDSYYTCEIHTEEEMSDDEILLVTQEKGRLPKEEWTKRIYNIEDYFKGYYTIEKTDYGYLYKGVYPYDDLSSGLKFPDIEAHYLTYHSRIIDVKNPIHVLTFTWELGEN